MALSPHAADEGASPAGAGHRPWRDRGLPAAAAPLLVAGLALLVAVAALRQASLRLTEHALVYPLDDAYIHMAVARNLAEHGVWGVTRHGFTSSSSSLLWPLVLAAGDALGAPPDALPLILNVIAAVLCLAVGAWALGPGEAGWRVAFLTAVVFVTPLPTLVLSGMEHTLHVAAALLFAGLFARTVDRQRPSRVLALAGAAALAAALRYESLLLVAAAGLVLLSYRRWQPALAVGLAGLAPPLAYALVSVARSWYPLPNPVLLKGASFDPATPAGLVELLGGRSLRMLWHTPHVLVMVLVSLGLLLLAPPRSPRRALPALFVLTALLHMQFADTGWLYRYEAYLVALGLLTLGLGVSAARAEWTPRAVSRVAVTVMAAVVTYPLLDRAVRAMAETPRACKNIFDQQYQMGLFLRRFYPGAAVVANDIGAISYMADIRLLDLSGLASMDVARARRAGGLTRETVARLAAAHRPDAVLIYRSWFGQAIPADWLEAGTWRAPEQVVVADRVVTFYALDPAGHARLVANLKAFQGEMPGDVAVRLRP